MLKWRAAWKVPGYVLLLAVLAVVAGATGWLARTDATRRRRASIYFASRFSRWILSWLGVRVKTAGTDMLPRAGCLIVSNHITDIDALLLSATLPCVFITSAEVRQNLFQGLVTRATGSTFVERRSAFGLPGELEETKRLLHQGFPIVLFPEATTSNGDGLLPFKPAFFQAAADTQCPIVPVCIRYLRIDGEPVTSRNRDQLYYYGAIGFLQHILRMCSLQSIEAECRFLPALVPAPGASRKEIARFSEMAIQQQYNS